MKSMFSGFFLAAVTILLLIGCTKDSGADILDISGEWKLESIGGVAAEEFFRDEIGGLDRYVSFTADGNFETFERIVDGEIYLRYDGTYSMAGISATGVYSDGSPWGAEYSVRMEDGNAALVMSASGEECIYRRTAIPADVRSSAVDVLSLKSASGLDAKGRFL